MLKTKLIIILTILMEFLFPMAKFIATAWLKFKYKKFPQVEGAATVSTCV